MLGINVSFGRLSSKIKHRRGFGSAGRPIEQFDDVDDGHADALADLHRAADIAGRDDVRVEPREIGGLAVAELTRDLGLERSEGRGVGKGSVGTFRSRWWP